MQKVQNKSSKKKIFKIASIVMAVIAAMSAFAFVSLIWPNKFEPFASKLINESPVRVAQNVVYPTNTFTSTPTFTNTPIPPTATPIPPTETPTPVVTQVAQNNPVSGKIIDVNLSTQSLTAYQNGQVYVSTLISTGLPGHDTPTGTFYVQRKIESELMAGEGYYLPGVPYTQYFYGLYALHGTYWHSNFGYTMSHGCVNLPTDMAAALYWWTDSSTPIVIHY